MTSAFPTHRWLTDAPILHRGFHNNKSVPENSLSAFERALRVKLPVEMDVHLLADGVPVVFHDTSLRRMTGCRGNIERHTSQTIKQFALPGTGEAIPLLAEVLDLVRGAVPLLIELKTNHLVSRNLEQTVCRMLHSYSGEYALQSFNPLSVCWLRKHASHVCRGQLSGAGLGVPLHPFTRPDFISYQVDALPNRAVTRLHQRGIPLLAWTVCTRRQLGKARQEADNCILEVTAETFPWLSGRIG